jgi:hypothetical protein
VNPLIAPNVRCGIDWKTRTPSAMTRGSASADEHPNKPDANVSLSETTTIPGARIWAGGIPVKRSSNAGSGVTEPGWQQRSHTAAVSSTTAAHAMQFNGINYLMPADAKLDDEADLYQFTKVDDVLSYLLQGQSLFSHCLIPVG